MIEVRRVNDPLWRRNYFALDPKNRQFVYAFVGDQVVLEGETVTVVERNWTITPFKPPLLTLGVR